MTKDKKEQNKKIVKAVEKGGRDSPKKVLEKAPEKSPEQASGVEEETPSTPPPPAPAETAPVPAPKPAESKASLKQKIFRQRERAMKAREELGKKLVDVSEKTKIAADITKKKAMQEYEKNIKSGNSSLKKVVFRFGEGMEKLIEDEKLGPYVKKVDEAIAFMSRKNYEVENEAVAVARGPIVFGLWLFVFVFVVLGGWAACAPLDSAAIAPGSVVLDTNKKTIQHLEGGIISEIMVKEGQEVRAGQPLIRLSETNAKARMEILSNQYTAAKATEARLIAERAEAREITFDDDLLLKQDDPDVASILESQRQLFVSRKRALEGSINVLKQRMKQFGDEINGLEAQEKSAASQIALIDEEIDTVQQLVDKGQGLKPRLLSLQRKKAELEGGRGEYLALIARAKQSITENELQIINIKNEFQGEVIKLLRETQDALADLKERVGASEDILERIVITAPQAGIVTGLNYHTIGGVIGPGSRIMDIVPQDDRLIIEARVDPRDIDIVHRGLEAKVRLSAYKVRFVPPFDGVVVNVSADRFVDEASGQAYYLARVEIDSEVLDQMEEVELYPGMPAEVLIVTGERTFLSYLMSPITDSFRHAFREQ